VLVRQRYTIDLGEINCEVFRPILNIEKMTILVHGNKPVLKLDHPVLRLF
jgi:hypothetical protein